ncbi:methyltransferase [Actinokineospora sp. HUAS TT18]|uniref:methyltransferase n=1 Tax=Actinokineospora sp. HUAS TT18 TaxID=3447451 RepID=UPI003F51D727
MEHTPTVSPEYAARVKAWHEAAYRESRRDTDETFDYLGRTFVVPPQVHPINPFSHLLGEAVLTEVQPGDRVLDMGTGCGVNAILAAATAADVVAVDTNPHALAAARANAERNNVQVDVRHSDVFSAVDGRFDLIVFDPPFRWFTPRDHRESASTDAGYRAMNTFFAQARDHLTPTGRMLIFFGTSGDLAHLHTQAEAAGFTTEVVATDGLDKDGWHVDYFTYRMVPAATAAE